MTGWNIASSDRIMQTDLTVWSIESQMAHIRDYCDAHSLKLYVEAVIDLAAAMKRDDAKAHGAAPAK